ncbi:MAG: glycosyltransferase family 4 protein [Chloroflexi bacterium]|nr:glycosyltransferase family 4 protein [Chloroflexota bacterium]
MNNSWSSDVGKRLFFVYRFPVRRTLAAIERGELPESYAMGYHRCGQHGFDVSCFDGEDWSRSWQALARAINPPMAKLLGVPFDASGALHSLGAMRDRDLVFTILDGAGLPVMLLRLFRLLRTPVVHHTGELIKQFRTAQGSLRWRLARRLLRQATCIVCDTRTQEEWLTGFMQIPSSSVLCLNSIAGVDLEFLDGRPVTDEGFVLCVGRERHRDFELLFQVARQLPHVDFVAVGTGKRFAGLDAPANVRTFVDLPYLKVVDLYRSARLVALPLKDNRYSMAGRVVGEAMALGKAVVLSNVEALRGIGPLESGECCVLVDPGDLGQLTEAVRRLYNDAALRETLGQKAKVVARDCFSLDQYVARMSQLFTRIAGERQITRW